jgi:hypothetical protein
MVIRIADERCTSGVPSTTRARSSTRSFGSVECRQPTQAAVRVKSLTVIGAQKVRFAADSPVEGTGF